MSQSEKSINETSAAQKDLNSTVTIPLVNEEIAVDKKQVDTGVVRVRKTIHEHEETINQPLHQTTASVERVTINRIIDHPVETHYDGDVLIVPILEEILVVQKRWMLKEELRISKRMTKTRHIQQVALRSEEAIIEREENSKNSNN